MATMVAHQQCAFRGVFSRELGNYLEKLQTSEGKDPARLELLRALAEDFASSISERMLAYADRSDLDIAPADFATDSPSRARLDELEAELRARCAEEEQLRCEVLARMKANSDERIVQGSLDLLGMRQSTAFAVPSGEATIKGQQLQWQLQQCESVCSITNDFAATLEQERENNFRIAHQRCRPLQTEPDLQTSETEWHESTAAEIARNTEVCKRMQKQFGEFA